jgi:hypothetical protein
MLLVELGDTLVHYLWILVIGVFIARMIVPVRSKLRTRFMSIEDVPMPTGTLDNIKDPDQQARKKSEYKAIPLGTAEKKHYDNFRSHSITLASFTMTVIAIIIAFPIDESADPAEEQKVMPLQKQTKENLVSQNIMSLFYLSLAMVSFFIASYLFLLRETRWLVYTGESLEYMGIVSVGIGLLSLMQNITNNNNILGVIYAFFVIGITIIAIIQIWISIRFFYPKKS